MEHTPSDKATIEHQFDALMKKVLSGEAKNLKSKAANREAHEANFCELSERLVDSFCSYDEHLSDYFSFEVYGFDIIIKNELLGEAVDNLPEKKRMIILMSYFLDMTDYEIADVLNLVRSTVTYHRESALAKLKRFMEEMTDDEGE